MKTLRWTLRSAALSICLSAPLLAQEQADTAPQWTPGGHYTAELDLTKGELKLLPLDGADQTLVAHSACELPKNLVTGVYILVNNGRTWSLVHTHPAGLPEAVGPEAINLAACGSANDSPEALRLPAATLLAMENAAVGAIYIHQ